MKKVDKAKIIGYWKRRGSARSYKEYQAVAAELGVSLSSVRRAITTGRELDNTGRELDNTGRELETIAKVNVSAVRKVMHKSYMTDYEKEYLSRFDAAPKTLLGYIANNNNGRVWF